LPPSRFKGSIQPKSEFLSAPFPRLLESPRNEFSHQHPHVRSAIKPFEALIVLAVQNQLSDFIDERTDPQRSVAFVNLAIAVMSVAVSGPRIDVDRPTV
jgi:hypothetical protein